MSEQRDQSEETSSQSFGEQLGDALVWLFRVGLRLLVVVVLGVIVGGALYWGALFLYQRYVASVQDNQAQLAALATRQVQDGQRVRGRLDDFGDRLDTLEQQMDSSRESLADLQSRVDQLAEEVGTQAGLPDDLENAQQRIAEVEDSFERSNATQSAALADLQSDLSAQEETLNELSAAIAELDQRTARLGSALDGENSPAALAAELDQLRVMGLILRGRLLVSLGNYNLAQADLQLAGEMLSELVAGASGARQEQLDTAFDLLGAAFESLPDEPVAAVDALEGAWQLLLEAEPPGGAAAPEDRATEAISTAEESTGEIAPTETPTPAETPLPAGMPTATTTPSS